MILARIVRLVLCFVRVIFWIADYIWPKRVELILFPSSRSTYAGNGNVLYWYALQHSGFDVFQYERPGTKRLSRILYPMRLSVMSKVLSAKTVVVTCGLDDFSPFAFSQRKYIVQLWHGSVGFKGEVLTEHQLSEKLRSRALRAWKRFDTYISPSWVSAYIRCVNCGYDIRKVFFCGAPRNDSIINRETPHNRYLDRLREELSVKRFLLYAPTYRRNRPVKVFPFDDFNIQELDDFLEKQQAVILIRTHPSDVGGDDAPYGTRIVKFADKECSDINAALHYFSVLITDYSSIYVDFLLLNRPIVFLLYDLGQYAKEVGLVCDNYDFWTPGPKPSTFAEFLSALDRALTTPDAEAAKRLALNTIFNTHQTGDSSKRILAMIREKVGKGA